MNQSGVGCRNYWVGIQLFNDRRFFEAHEVLEDVWRAAPAPEKKFLQGLIQLAVGFHHHSTGNIVGAQSLISRGARNLSVYPEEFGGVRLGGMLREVFAWQRALEQGAAPPPLPRLEITRC